MEQSQTGASAPTTLPPGTNLTSDQQAAALMINEKLNNIVTSAVKLYPQIKQSCTNASIALSKVQKVDTPAEDEYSNKLLAKVGTTYDTNKALRMGITGDLDTLKEFLMEPEKLISTDPKATGSQYYRVKQLRNGYATAEKKKADDIAADLKKKQDIANHKAWISAEIERNITNGMFAAVSAVATWATNAWPTVTLENIEAFAAKLNSVPVLKQDLYKSWFNVAINPNFVTREDHASLQTEAQSVHTYELKNADFSSKATAQLKHWADKLPAHKKELEDIALLAQTDAAAAAAKTAEAAATVLEESNSQAHSLESDLQESLLEIAATENNAKLTNSFATQAGLQGIAPTGGKVVKIGTIVCPEEEVVQVVAELFYNCYLHPLFGGIIKKGKDKMLKHDENGRPEYIDFIESLLKFYANNCTPTIAGIAITEAVNSTVKR